MRRTSAQCKTKELPYNASNRTIELLVVISTNGAAHNGTANFHSIKVQPKSQHN